MKENFQHWFKSIESILNRSYSYQWASHLPSHLQIGMQYLCGSRPMEIVQFYVESVVDLHSKSWSIASIWCDVAESYMWFSDRNESSILFLVGRNRAYSSKYFAVHIQANHCLVTVVVLFLFSFCLFASFFIPFGFGCGTIPVSIAQIFLGIDFWLVGNVC